ncbi:MAG: PTS sugar transporter subunit IIC [Brevinema sp.]
MKWIEEKLVPRLGAISNNMYISCIKDGMVGVMGLAIIGSFFLLIAYPPVPSEWYETNFVLQWIAMHRSVILMPYEATMSLIALFCLYGIATAYAKFNNLAPVSMGMLSGVAFFMTFKWTPAVAKPITQKVVEVTVENLSVLQEISGQTLTIGDKVTSFVGETVNLGLNIPVGLLGSKGIFVVFLCVFTVGKIMRVFRDKKWTIKMPDGVPEAVGRAFDSLLPLLTVVSLFGLLHVIPVFLPQYFPEGIIDLHVILQNLLFWLPMLTDTFFGALLITIFLAGFWVVGIHGAAMVNTFVTPIFIQFLYENSQAFINGEPIPHLVTNQFFMAFVWLGGGGATMGLVILLAFFSRSEYLKTFGKTIGVPTVFNINEPVIFGTPIVANSYLFIPFILAPVVNMIVAYLAISFEMVNRTVATAMWTLPGPIYAFIATGGDWRAIVLFVVNLILSTMIYYPFFRAYDNKLFSDEQN